MGGIKANRCANTEYNRLLKCCIFFCVESDGFSLSTRIWLTENCLLHFSIFTGVYFITIILPIIPSCIFFIHIFSLFIRLIYHFIYVDHI